MSKSKKKVRVNAKGVVLIIAILAVLTAAAFFVCKYVLHLGATDETRYIEADEGVISDSATFRAVITRNEQVVVATGEGVVEYYYPELTHLSSGTLVCSLRNNYFGELLQTKLNEVYRKLMNEVVATEIFAKQNADIAADLARYLKQSNFNGPTTVYDLKHNLLQAIGHRYDELAISGNAEVHALLEEEGVYASEMDAASVHYYMPNAGLVLYSCDGYEGWTAEQVENDFLTRYDGSYHSIGLNMQQVENGTKLYRCVSSEEWYLTVFCDFDTMSAYEIGQGLELKANGIALNGRVIQKMSDGRMILLVTEKLGEFLDQRILSLTFGKTSQEGIKVPKECIRNVEYHYVPIDCVFQTGSQSGVMIQDGEEGIFVPVSLIYRDEENAYFVLPPTLAEGEMAMVNGKAATFELGPRKALPTVAVQKDAQTEARVVRILYESASYAIIEGVSARENLKIY